MTSAGSIRRYWMSPMHRFGGFAAMLGVVCLWPYLSGGCSAPETGSPTDNNPPDVQQQPDVLDLGREIEEADIVKEVDGYFYLANPYKGLRIIDARDMAAPTLAGGLTIAGRGVELYVRDDHVFLFSAADFIACAGTPVAFGAPEISNVLNPDYGGSRLSVVDVADKRNPTLTTKLDFAGFVSASRRVGDVLYVAGNYTTTSESTDGNANANEAAADNSNENSDSGTSSDVDIPAQTGVYVASILIADPTAVSLVETLNFPGNSLDIHVSDTAMYVLGIEQTTGNQTEVTYVDIRDPAGDIVARDQFRVPGVIENRCFADEFQGTFRIVTDELDMNTFSRSVALYTYNIANPDDVQRLAMVPIIQRESLRSVRFDGRRAYAVTFVQTDPLFVLDLADPAAPKVAGQLEVPGFSTYLFPRGVRLIGVGIDNSQAVRPAVSLYDVSDPAAPTQLARVILGEEYAYGTTSSAMVDEKALKIIDSAGLILMPFSGYREVQTTGFFGLYPGYYGGTYFDSLQIIRWKDDTLVARGLVDHPGLVRRAGVKDGSLWVLSDLGFQSVDIANLDDPKPLGSVAIISDQELLDAGLSDCVATAGSTGQEVTLGVWGFTEQPTYDSLTAYLLYGFPFGCMTGSFLLLTTCLIGATQRRRRPVE